MKNTIITLLILIVPVFVIQCEKIERINKVETKEVTDIEQNSAKVTGVLVDMVKENTGEFGFVYNTSPSPGLENFKIIKGNPDKPKEFSANLTGLTAGTDYFIRAYYYVSTQVVYGKELTFKTLDAVKPTVITSEIGTVTSSSAICGGNVTGNGGSSITDRGICWSTDQNPDISGPHSSAGLGTNSGLGTFSVNITTGLEPLTHYYCRAYASNVAGTSYGDPKEFTTLQNVSLPQVTTTLASQVTSRTAKSGGTNINNGNGIITAKGVCWSTSSIPTLTSPYFTNEGTGTSNFTSDITGLIPATKYYYCAYATNAAGTKFGSVFYFTTLAAPAQVEITSISNISTSGARINCNIIAPNGTITARGICYSENPNPTMFSNVVPCTTTGTGSYYVDLTGLPTGTRFYVKAYATNSTGSSLSQGQSEFNTKIIDINGVTYNTVTIGSQVWMKENLKTSLFRNGEAIDYITSSSTWISSTDPAYCYYNNNGNLNGVYGKLYNFYAIVDSRGLCPEGWHVPSDYEWQTLINFLGGQNVAGGKMKEAGIDHWNSPNTGATNESGFTALPGGIRRSADGVSILLNTGGYFWTSNTNVDNGIYYYLMNIDATTHTGNIDKKSGFSVRCVKDY